MKQPPHALPPKTKFVRNWKLIAEEINFRGSWWTAIAAILLVSSRPTIHGDVRWGSCHATPCSLGIISLLLALPTKKPATNTYVLGAMLFAVFLCSIYSYSHRQVRASIIYCRFGLYSVMTSYPSIGYFMSFYRNSVLSSTYGLLSESSCRLSL